MKRRPYILAHRSGPDALALAGEALAIEPTAFGRAFLPTDARLEADPESPSGMVAVVHVTGPLFQRSFESPFGSVEGYDAIVAKFDAALKHPQVGAVVLLIDSPGGAVAGCFEAVRRMREARRAASKPVFAYADELAASAAYAIACVADQGIFVPKSGDVGSVGVLSVHAEVSAANEQAGFKVTVVRSGPRKAEGNPVEPLGDVARAAMQLRVDELALQFFELVAEARGISVEQVRAFEGALFSGQQAAANGLATRIATLEEVLTMAAQAAGVPMAMTDEEKAEMDRLKAENEDLKAKLAEEEEEEETPPPPPEEEEEEETAEAKVARLEAEIAKRDIAAAITASGKVPPGNRAEMIELGERIGLAGLKVVLKAMPTPPVARKGHQQTAITAAAVLTPTELTVAKQMGISPEQFAKTKAEMAAQKETV